jgi:putative ABC transport system permease protein
MMQVPADLSYALRSLRRTPEFTVTAVLTLGASIGAVTAMLGIVLGVLLRPLPVAEQDRVVLVRKEAPRDRSLRAFPHADIAGFLARSRAVERVAGVQYDGAFPYVVGVGADAFSAMGSMVSGEFFEVLGVRPAVGRLLDRRDEAPGAAPAMVISHGLWQRRFGGDSSVVGRTLSFDYPHTIIGVAPPGFEYPARVEMWVPLELTPEVTATRDYQPFSLVARLRPGASMDAVRRDAVTYVREIESLEPPGYTRGLRAVVLPFEEAVLGDSRRSIEILFIAVVVLLVLAWGNVANLLLMRATGRSGELALRSALGADPGDLMRPLLAEATLLAVGGAALALPLAHWALVALIAVAPPEIPRLDSVGLGPWAPGWVAALAALTVLVAGMGPAAWSARRGHGLRLGPYDGGTTLAGRRARSALVVLQIGLALLLTAGAGVLTVSLRRLHGADMGFAADSVILVKIGLPAGAYETRDRHLGVFDELARRVAGAPGVAGATPVIISPFTGPGGWDASFVAEGQGAGAELSNPTLNLETIAPGYFETMGIPLVRGRGFEATDRSGTVPVAIVSRRLALRLWGEANPIGRRIKLGGLASDWPWLGVVGVAGDTRYRELREAPLTFYIPFLQTANPGLRPRYLAVRSHRDAGAILGEVRAAAREVDANLLVPESASVSQLRATPLARPRLTAALAGMFALLALGLAAVGVYGMVAVLVVQRTHEFGVRVALGAQPGHVRRLVLAQGAAHAAAGIAIGLVVWLGVSRVLRSVVYEATPTDPVAVAGAASLLLAAAVAASYLPARRATRIDPVQLLRSE